MPWRGGILLLLLLIVTLLEAQTCTDETLKACMMDIQALVSNQNFGFAKDEDDLNKVCGHMQGSIECVNNFTKKCFKPTQQQLYQTLTSGAQSLLGELCSDSPFRREYLKHARCYSTVADEYKQCSERYNDYQNRGKDLALAPTDKLKLTCCLFDWFKDCTRKAVLTKCSTEAADLSTEIIEKAAGPVIESQCSHVTPGDCVESMELVGATGTALRPPSTTTLSLVISFLCFFLLPNNRF